MESIEQMLPPVWGPLAARLGETQYGVKRGLDAAVASMIEALAQRSGDLPFMTRIRLLAGEAERPLAMAAAASAGAQPVPRGARFLTVALGGRRAETAASVARIANVSPVSADAILTAAAPLLMEALGERVRDDATDAEALASLLGSEAGAVGGYLIPPTVSQPAAREGKGVGAALALSAIGLLLTAGLWWWSGRDRPPHASPVRAGNGTAHRIPARDACRRGFLSEGTPWRRRTSSSPDRRRKSPARLHRGSGRTGRHRRMVHPRRRSRAANR